MLTVAALSSVLLACSGPPAEVVIDTRVGEAQARSQREEALRQLSALRDVAIEWWQTRDERRAAAAGAKHDAPPDPTLAPNYEAEPPRDASAFAAQVRAIREGPIDEVATPLHNLAQAGPQVWPEIRELLVAERERPKREYKQVLAVIGGDVPNRYGHFALHWKKAHGYDVRLSEDWFGDLLALAPARISKLLRPVYRDALLTCALARAATHVAAQEPELTGEVVASLLDAAYVHGGTFRDEIGRSIDALGDPAIPHLLRESIPPEEAEEGTDEERRAAYASYCLDRMDRLHPTRAVEAVAGDRRLLADVLAAYGEVRDGEAAPLLLDWIDADAPGVRRAARGAFEQYVTGPLPKVRRKSIRLLGGRTSTQRAELSYREHARLAIRARIEADEPELLEPECELFESGGIVNAECERQPERLSRAYLALLDERRAARRDALIARALSHSDRVEGAAMLDTLLTGGGEEVEPNLLAPFYVEVAAEAEAEDPARAAQLLRKSAMLLAEHDEVRSRELTVDALVLESEIEGVDLRGREMLLASAPELDPASEAVSAAMGRLADDRLAGGAKLREGLAWTILALLAGLGVLAWIGALIHRGRPRPQRVLET